MQLMWLLSKPNMSMKMTLLSIPNIAYIKDKYNDSVHLIINRNHKER